MAAAHSSRHNGANCEAAVPLLQPSQAPPSTSSVKRRRGCAPLCLELREVFSLALPIIVTTMVPQVATVASQAFSGHLGTNQLAAAALSNTWFSLLWYFILGVSTALDTLGSQAVGAGNKEALKVWTVCAALVLTALNIPLGVMMWYGGTAARVLFQQGPEVAGLATVYCRGLTPGLWITTMVQVLQKYLQVQGIVNPPAVCSAIAIVITIGACWVGADWGGLEGVAWATTGSRVALAFMVLIAVAVCERSSRGTSSVEASGTAGAHAPCEHGEGMEECLLCQQETFLEKTWQRVKAALDPSVVWDFLALGLPGGVMLGLEVASFEVTVVFAGFLGAVAVAAHAAVYCVTTLSYIALPFALSSAATIRVGNLVGAGHGQQAALSSKIVLGLGTSFMAVTGLLIFFLRYEIAALFTNGDPKAVAAIVLIAPVGALYQLGDGILGTCAGVLRGLGRQVQLMVLNMVCFWGIGVPTGYLLTFHFGWGLIGLWVGMSTGGYLAAFACLLLVAIVDWKKEVEVALKHVAVSDHAAHEEAVRAHSRRSLTLSQSQQRRLLAAITPEIEQVNDMV